MDTELMMKLLYSAAKDLLENQPDILTATSQTGMTEWNLAHHYSNELTKYLFWFDNDNDVSKKQVDKEKSNIKRPDIIYHKRQTNKYNFIAIEMKKADKIIEDDKQKFNDYWFTRGLEYKYGACISFNEKGNFLIWVKCRETNQEIYSYDTNLDRLEIIKDKVPSRQKLRTQFFNEKLDDGLELVDFNHWLR